MVRGNRQVALLSVTWWMGSGGDKDVQDLRCCVVLVEFDG